jgi:ABC-type glycerol-3-phosphate transport system substrate-binding protein
VNKDLLNAAGVTTIPGDWSAFQEAVPKLVKQDAQGEIAQAGAALGSGVNIERAPDILSVLMMQNGTRMADEDGTPTFNELPRELEAVTNEPPIYRALTFYTDFANPSKEVYTWNNRMPNSLDAFIQGKTAFFFGYNYHLPIIKARGPKINLGISKLPQIEGNPVVNFANYWAFTVSKKSKNTDLAWNFLNFARTPDENKKFLDASKRPAALRAQLTAQLEDEDVGVFASQVLTAKSWYRGTNPKAADDAFIVLIESALLTDPEKYNELVTNALDKVNQTVTRTQY